jgi:membrane associated rhomboid family serine protease
MFSNRQGGLEQIPPVVKSILIINIVVFLVQQVGWTFTETYFALHYWGSPLFRWWQLVTHMFMHASLMHIFFNMFALVMFGRVLEEVMGAKRFLAFYLICGLGAAVCHLGVLTWQFIQLNDAFLYYQEHPTIQQFALVLQKGKMTDPAFSSILQYWSDHPDCSDCAQVSMLRINEYYNILTSVPTVGASGAVYGLLFGFGFLFPNAELMLLFPPIPVKAKWMVAVYALIELSMGLKNSVDDNIAHFAHLGGMIFAFLLLKLWRVRRHYW